MQQFYFNANRELDLKVSSSPYVKMKQSKFLSVKTLTSYSTTCHNSAARVGNSRRGL